MTRQEQLKLAYRQDESARTKVARQRSFEDDLDEQIEAALKRYELRNLGLDAHKWLADEITDDPEHPVAVSTVYDLLARRNGRRPPAEVIAAIFREDDEFAAWWCATMGYRAPERLRQISAERENELLKLKLREFGAIGEQKLREVAGTRTEP